MKLCHAALVAALLAVPALAACGSDDSSTAPTTVAPADPGSGSGAHSYATGPDDVVLSIGYDGGFVPVGFMFSNTPSLLVTGDGRVFTPGVQTMQYPGPMISPTNVQTLTPEGIEALLALADEHGLLAQPPVYAGNDMIADAATTFVKVTVDGVTYEHQAYALGLTADQGPEPDPARQRLATFVDAALALDTAVPAGSASIAEPFVPEAYEIQSMPAELPVDDGSTTGSTMPAIDPTTVTDPSTVADSTVVEQAIDEPVVPPVVAWTSDTGIALAAATDCVQVPAGDAAATALLVDGVQNTIFTDAGAAYQVFVRPHLPGGPTC